MAMEKLASRIAKREGKRSQARIGDIREILKIIVEMQVEAVGNLAGGPIDALSERVAKKLAKFK